MGYATLCQKCCWLKVVPCPCPNPNPEELWSKVSVSPGTIILRNKSQNNADRIKDGHSRSLSDSDTVPQNNLVWVCFVCNKTYLVATACLGVCTDLHFRAQLFKASLA